MEGPGNYDTACTVLREITQAQCVIAIILGGNKGNGFSMHAVSPEYEEILPNVLRDTADSIEKSVREKKGLDS